MSEPMDEQRMVDAARYRFLRDGEYDVKLLELMIAPAVHKTTVDYAVDSAMKAETALVASRRNVPPQRTPAPPAEDPSDSAAMVNRFLTWPLPESVCSDPCATMQGYPQRTGTNLLTADEALAMLEHVLRDDPHASRLCRDCGKTVERKPSGIVVISSAEEGPNEARHAEPFCPHCNPCRRAAEITPLEDALRSLASWLSAGGYNAPTVNAKEFEAKIRWGVENAINEALANLRKHAESMHNDLQLVIIATPDLRDAITSCRAYRADFPGGIAP